MFDWLKKKTKDDQARPSVPEILGFRLGGVVELNDLKLRLLEGKLTFEKVAKQQMIQAVGVVKLDANTSILRYYTDDDGFFQVVLEGGMTENHINDVQLWFYYDTKGVANESDWNTLLKNSISQPTYSLGDHTYTRLWEDVGEKSFPVPMIETTHAEDGTQSLTDQFVMLYERTITDDMVELLMISGEESIAGTEHERCLVKSTGIPLSSADFEVVA